MKVAKAEKFAGLVIRGDPSKPRCRSVCPHHEGHPGPCEAQMGTVPEVRAYWKHWVIEKVLALPRKPGRRPNGKLCETRTVSEIAEEAGCSRRTVYDWLDKTLDTKPPKPPPTAEEKAAHVITKTVRALRNATDADLLKKMPKEVRQRLQGALKLAQDMVPPETDDKPDETHQPDSPATEAEAFDHVFRHMEESIQATASFLKTRNFTVTDVAGGRYLTCLQDCLKTEQNIYKMLKNRIQHSQEEGNP